MADRLDPIFVRAQINALRAAYPQIADDEDQWLLTLESETDLREFLALAVSRICDAEGLGDSAVNIIQNLKARQQRFEDRADGIRALAFKLMSAAEVRKVELAQATLSTRAGTPRVIITDEARLPEHCIRIKREPNKVIIKELLERGEQVPGAELSNAGPSLSMRTK